MNPETTTPIFSSDQAEIKVQKRSMRRAFSRCGWAIFVLTASVFLISLGFSAIIVVLETRGIAISNFFNNNYLIFNEVIIGIAMLLGALVLLGLPKMSPEKHRVSPKMFFGFLLVMSFIGTLGSLMGTGMLTVWDIITKNNTTNQLNELLASVKPWQLFLCVGIIAPIIEEFFFRKLLIDRLLPHGEFYAILVSAAMFGLFHQNFSQLFYAFGLGVILGYLYCKSGSYIAVTLLHMAFNIIRGIVGTFVSQKILELESEMEYLSAMLSNDDILSAITLFISNCLLPILVYLVYLALVNGMNAGGVFVFAFNVKKIRLKHTESQLMPKEKRKAVMLNSGIIAATVLLAAFTVYSLFQ